METSRPKLSIIRKESVNSKHDDKFSEILIQESKPCLVRVKRNKAPIENTEQRGISSQEDEITSLKILSTSNSKGLEKADNEKIAQNGSVVEGKKHETVNIADKSIINSNQVKDAVPQKTDQSNGVSMTKSTALKKIFPTHSGVKDDVIVHSAFRDLKVDQEARIQATGPSRKHGNFKSGSKARYKAENGNLFRDRKSKVSSCKIIKNCESIEPDCSDEICDFVDEYQNLDMLFCEA